MTTPTVGRIVHYRSFGTPRGEYQPACRAAKVTEVGAWMPLGEPYDHGTNEAGQRVRTLDQVWEPEACALEVSNPTGLFFNTCRHDEDTKAGGTWHWPERVDG